MTNLMIAGAGRPIRLGALAPLSRPGFLEAGRHLRAGVELAVDEINRAGGVGGRPLELLLRDTAGVPDRAAAAVRELAAAGAVAVVGEYHSVVAHAAAGAAVAARLPFICSSAVLDAVVDAPTDVVARVAPAQSYGWRVYADHLAEVGRHVALVVQADRYWSSGARLLRGYLPERGVTVTEIDYAALLESRRSIADVVAEAGADVLLLLVGYPEPAVSLVQAVRADTRLSGLRIGDPAGRAEFPQWQQLLGEDGAHVSLLCYQPAQPSALGTRVAGQLRRILDQSPSFVAFEGFDAVQVAAEAVRVAGPDREGVIEALPGIRVEGTRGTIGFSRGPDGSSAVLQWVWPPVRVAVVEYARHGR